MEAFLKEIKKEKKSAETIKKHMKFQTETQAGDAESKEAKVQFFNDMIALQDAHLAHLKKYDALVKALKSAQEYIVAGRADLARMYLAETRLWGAKIRYDSHLVGRDLVYWYQDYFIKEDDSTTAPAKIIAKENKKFKTDYEKIAVEKKVYDKMFELVVGPGMLIAGILLGVIGVCGVVYWIKRKTKATDQEVFGLQSSHYEKNDMMVRFYTQNQEGDDPTEFFKK